MAFDLRIYDRAQSASCAAAAHIGGLLRAALAARGACTLALSGGKTPAHMLELLASELLSWQDVDILQVDERITRRGRRNLSVLQRAFGPSVVTQSRFHAMPVAIRDPECAAHRYSETIEAVAGNPAVLDVVHLGLGADGHTASLVPGDPVLEETRRNVAVTRSYRGYRRLTLTLPCLARAHDLVWLVTGTEKADAVARFVERDSRIAASRLPHEKCTVHIDRAAATLIAGPYDQM